MPNLITIYKVILNKFVNSSLLPILFIQVLFIVFLFMLNNNHLDNAKNDIRNISDEIFSEISNKVQSQVEQHFTQLKDSVTSLNYLTNTFFNSTDFKDTNISLNNVDGFFKMEKSQRKVIFIQQILAHQVSQI